jgi:hypothetical protein
MHPERVDRVMTTNYEAIIAVHASLRGVDQDEDQRLGWQQQQIVPSSWASRSAHVCSCLGKSYLGWQANDNKL